MSTPFWREESARLTAQPHIPDYSLTRESRPHIHTRRSRAAYGAPGTDTPYVRDFDPCDPMAHDPGICVPKIQQNGRNLRATMVTRQVGTIPTIVDRGSHLGQGRLRDSIMGPQYYRRVTYEPQQARNLAGFTVKNETPVNSLPSEPIHIHDSPNRQAEQTYRQSRNYNYGHPGGDLNDPGDPDDNGPPGGPPGNGPPGSGPPRGPPGNPNPWRPRVPGGQNGAPGAPPGRGPPGGPPGGGPPGNNRQSQPADPFGVNDGFWIEKKIKISDLPEWDGNVDTILDWLNKLDRISYLSRSIYYDLGIIAPSLLTGAAKLWFDALEPHIQRHIQESWGDFKLAISTYFMNQQWPY